MIAYHILLNADFSFSLLGLEVIIIESEEVFESEDKNFQKKWSDEKTIGDWRFVYTVIIICEKTIRGWR